MGKLISVHSMQQPIVIGNNYNMVNMGQHKHVIVWITEMHYVVIFVLEKHPTSRFGIKMRNLFPEKENSSQEILNNQQPGKCRLLKVKMQLQSQPFM